MLFVMCYSCLLVINDLTKCTKHVSCLLDNAATLYYLDHPSALYTSGVLLSTILGEVGSFDRLEKLCSNHKIFRNTATGGCTFKCTM